MSYRDDVEALGHRVSALEQAAKDAERSLTEARRLLEDAEQRRRLPVLDNISVAAPCKADWGQMTGADRARFCGTCEKNVYNLSSMTRAEAEALLLAKEGKLCVRYYQRADGTILTADCPDGLRRRRRRRRVVAAAFGAMSAVAAAGALLHRGASSVTMGGIEPVAPVAVPVVEAPPVAMMGEPAPVKETMGKIEAPQLKMGRMQLTPPAKGGKSSKR